MCWINVMMFTWAYQIGASVLAALTIDMSLTSVPTYIQWNKINYSIPLTSVEGEERSHMDRFYITVALTNK